MADLSIVCLDPGEGDGARYELGPGNWKAPSIPDLARPGERVDLAEHEVIDVVILGDGHQTRATFEQQLSAWLTDLFAVDVYEAFSGAFRIRALFRASAEPCSSGRGSYYRIPVGTSGDDTGEVASDGWWRGSASADIEFRAHFFEDVFSFAVNPSVYPHDLDADVVNADGNPVPVIHNRLAGMHSHLVVVMLVRSTVANASGRTREVDEDDGSRLVNVAFGSHALHEFGHAFAYLEDEYISDRSRKAKRRNPVVPSIFTLSNLTFDNHIGAAPWHHLSPWGRRLRKAAGDQPSPLVGWLWRGGEQNDGVWHSEFHCLMNGRHVNYSYSLTETTKPGADLRFRRPPRYCLWCRELVTLRILEKTGRLGDSGDPTDINERGRLWYSRWVEIWRERYWDAFDVDRAIDEREALYASPGSEPGTFDELADGLGGYRRLDASDLCSVFAAQPLSTGPAPEDDEDALQTLLTNA
ncbi:hypothetical protein [Microbacterium sp.]|uniref:hypothetical protein n=1 Tax=Microbacterium sp. TaxID=51671 RepID=UPI003C736839